MSNDGCTQTTALAKRHWDDERAALRISAPWWPLPSWSRAAAWRKRSYLLAAGHGAKP